MYLTKEKSSPFYQIVFIVDGKRNKRTTKCKLKSDALAFLSEFELPEKSEGVQELISLSDFALEYINYSEKRLTKSSVSSIRTAFRIFVNSIDEQKLENIDRKLVDQFITNSYSRSKSSAWLYYRTLKAAFNKAIEWEYISENPFSKVKPPRIVEKNPIYIDEKILSNIIQIVDKPYLKDFCLAAFHTGMRAGELCNLKWSAVDLIQKIIIVRNTSSFTTKSKRERIIPINNTLLNMLRRKNSEDELEKDGGYLFFKVKGIKLNVDYVSKKFKKACRFLKLDEAIHLHVLRHSFASNIVQRGADLYVVKELLGHSSIAVTQKYAHLQRRNLFDAVNKLKQI
jgi:site-specific recombinase XerD